MRIFPARVWGALPLGVLLVVHLVVVLVLVAASFLDMSAYAALFQHPQFWGGLALSVVTGVVSTGLSLFLAVWIVARSRRDLLRSAGAMLALPHLAFAIGLVFVLVPTGLIARLLALVLGWQVPPQWITVQDPYGVALVLALVLKETPFLVWALASLLQRDDVRVALSGQMSVARSLGHGGFSVWTKVVLPQLLPRIVWPLVAVLSYGMTVVDMALVIGPTQPPTLASVIWRDLNDAEVGMNARGAAGVAVLSGVIGLVLASVVMGLLLVRPVVSRYFAAGPSYSSPRPRAGEVAERSSAGEGKFDTPLRHRPTRVGLGTSPARGRGEDLAWAVLKLIYVIILVVLVMHSIAGPWPFPQLLPSGINLRAWVVRVLAEPEPYLNSLLYGLATTFVAVVSSVTWFETQRSRRDVFVVTAAVASFTLPALVIALGQYRMLLLLGLTGTRIAVFLAHLLPVMAYVLIMLQGPYRGFDGRWRAVAAGLSASRWRFLMDVKWPMLKSSIFAAAAVGFAVSVAQFVPVQLTAAGRHVTLATETVTLSSGGNRGMIAVSALLMMVMPLVAFVAARHFGRPRWS